MLVSDALIPKTSQIQPLQSALQDQSKRLGSLVPLPAWLVQKVALCPFLTIEDLHICTVAGPEAAPVSFTNQTRNFQKTVHLKANSKRRKFLIRIMYKPQIHSIVKLLILTTPPELKKNNVGHRESTKRDFMAEAMHDHLPISEDGCDALTEEKVFDILLSPVEDVLEKLTEVKSQEIMERTSPAAITTFNIVSLSPLFDDSLVLGPTDTLASTAPRRKRPQRKFSYLTRQQCDYGDHPLASPDSDTCKGELNADSDNVIQMNIQQRYLNKSHVKSKIHLQIALHSFRKIKSLCSLISSVVSPPIIPSRYVRSSAKPLDSEMLSSKESLPLRLECRSTLELRQYLNPVANAPIEEYKPSLLQITDHRKCAISIPMQTYKISISNIGISQRVISRRTKCLPDEISKNLRPKIQKRDMRENSDFFRMAVMEMLMRKRGKLDDERPGKAKLILPPRTLSLRPTENTVDGIPIRWVPLTA